MKKIITITASLLAVATLCGVANAAGMQHPAGPQPAQTLAAAPIVSAQSPVGANANAVAPSAVPAAAQPAPSPGAQVQQPTQVIQATENPASASPGPSSKMGPGCPPCPPCIAQNATGPVSADSGVRSASVSTQTPAAPTQPEPRPVVIQSAPADIATGVNSQTTIAPAQRQVQSDRTSANCGPGAVAQGINCGPSKSTGQEQAAPTGPKAESNVTAAPGMGGAQSSDGAKSQIASAHVPPPGQEDCACCDREPVKSAQQEKAVSPVTSAPAQATPPAASPITAKPAPNAGLKPPAPAPATQVEPVAQRSGDEANARMTLRQGVPASNPPGHTNSGQAVQAQPSQGAVSAGQPAGGWKQVPAAQGGPVQAQQPAAQTQTAPYAR